MQNVKHYKIIQNRRGHVVVKIVKDLLYGKKDEKNNQLFSHHLKDITPYSIKYVDKLPISKSGKMKMIDSKYAKKYENFSSL